MSNIKFFILEGKEPKEVSFWDSVKWEVENFRTTGKAKIHVGNTYIGDNLVSTVFISFDIEGTNHFETMIFGGKFDQWKKRYGSWEEAEAGHAEAVEMVTKDLKK